MIQSRIKFALIFSAFLLFGLVMGTVYIINKKTTQVKKVNDEKPAGDDYQKAMESITAKTPPVDENGKSPERVPLPQSVVDSITAKTPPLDKNGKPPERAPLPQSVLDSLTAQEPK